MSVKVSRRCTKQRQLVLDALRENPVHPTADYIYSKLKTEYPEISLGTVYRNLSVLCEQGEISRVHGNFASDHFDGNPEPHYHFMCTKCGEIFDMDLSYINYINDEAQQSCSHRVDAHAILFSGCCVDCLDK